MARFRFTEPLAVPMMLLIPTYQTVKGVPKKAFPDVSEGIRINGSFRTYGGTERDVNGLYSVENTAIIETWYRPDIKSDCRIAVLSTGKVYEILGEPENISLRNQFIRMKVTHVTGGA